MQECNKNFQWISPWLRRETKLKSEKQSSVSVYVYNNIDIMVDSYTYGI